MGDYNKWKAQVNEWRRVANVIESESILVHKSYGNFDLTKIKIRICAKCGTRAGRIHRHHKGHEYLFACILPDRYSQRYIEFRDTDVVLLCDKCHLKVHKLYGPRLEALWPLLALNNGTITYEQCELFRTKLIRCCDRWLKYKKKTKRRKHVAPRTKQDTHTIGRSPKWPN